MLVASTPPSLADIKPEGFQMIFAHENIFPSNPAATATWASTLSNMALKMNMATTTEQSSSHPM
jgi:hypothetical protein